MTDFPAKLPQDPSTLEPRAQGALINRIVDALMWLSPIVNPAAGTVQPPAEYRYDGFLAYADGTNWDPGSGKGFYRYEIGGGTWVFIG